MAVSITSGKNWQETYDGLLRKVRRAIPESQIKTLLDWQELYRTECSLALVEPAGVKLLDAIRRLDREGTFADLPAQIQGLMDRVSTAGDYPLGRPSELLAWARSAFEGGWAEHTHVQASLNLSTPECLPDILSLNYVCRFLDGSGRLGLRVKGGVFVDPTHGLLCEIGCVYPPKTLKVLSRQTVTLDVLQTRSPLSISMMRAGMNGFRAAIAEGVPVCGIDLTPAHLQIVPLSLRLGGEMVDPAAFDQYRVRLQHALEFSLGPNADAVRSDRPDLWQLAADLGLPEKSEPLLVSLMVHNKLLIDRETLRPLVWEPPRILKLWQPER